MKRLIFLISVLFLIVISLLVVSFNTPEKKFYYGFDEKIYIRPLDNKIVVRYNTEGQAGQGIEQAKRQFPGITAEKSKTTAVVTSYSSNDLTELKNYLIKQAGIRYIKPVYAFEDTGSELIVTDEIVVKFKSHISHQAIDSLNKLNSVLLKKAGKIFDVYSLPDDRDVIEVANAYQESGLVVFAHPNFIMEIVFHQAPPNDPYFVNQFYLHNTGQIFNDGHSGTANADIDAPEAWTISEGSSSIVVAVLDMGVTYNHADLPSTRQVRHDGSNFGDGDPDDPSPQGDNNHGNACAGIIAATKNNSIGIAGIAPNVKIMPVRIFNTNPLIG